MGDLTADLLINLTPIGMAGGVEADSLGVRRAAIETARVVFDVVALPPETPLIRRARALGQAGDYRRRGVRYQAVEQFALYRRAPG